MQSRNATVKRQVADQYAMAIARAVQAAVQWDRP